MFINTQKSVFSRMAVELGRRSKDIIAIAGDRDSALLNSINVVPIGGGDFAVKAIDYGKYVNGYQREVDGAGFIDDGVTAAQIDGYDVDVVI
jgi:hypothetical protein